MPQACRICRHPQRQALEAALADEGASYREIAQRFGVTKDSVARHWNNHVLSVTVEAAAAEVAAASGTAAALSQAMSEVSETRQALRDYKKKGFVAETAGESIQAETLSVAQSKKDAARLAGQAVTPAKPVAPQPRQWVKATVRIRRM